MSSTPGKVLRLFITPHAGAPMEERLVVAAVVGAGLVGDRYYNAQGSWNKGNPGKRQVTLINVTFLEDTDFTSEETRRNILTEGVELMRLIGQEFQIGCARFRGVKYCYTCNRPSGLAKKITKFQQEFHDRGGLIAEVIEGGAIEVNDQIITPFDDD